MLLIMPSLLAVNHTRSKDFLENANLWTHHRIGKRTDVSGLPAYSAGLELSLEHAKSVGVDKLILKRFADAVDQALQYKKCVK